MSDLEALDQLGLVNQRPFHHRLLFGQTNAHGAMRRARTSSRINGMPSAFFTLDRSLLPPEPVDYLAPVVMYAEHASGLNRPLFTGSVISVELDDPDEIEIQALGGRTLAEATAPSLATSNVSYAEIAHLLARVAGLGESQIRVEGIDQPRELFEVIVPVDGMTVTGRLEFGAVTFLSYLPVWGFHQTHLTGHPEFFGADAYAVAYSTATQTYTAEQEALARIELAVASILARCRYGLARLPGGEFQSFDRERAIATPTIRESVFVRGLATQRRWLRSLSTGELRNTLDLADEPLTFARIAVPPANIDPKTEQAILALARASRERDATARVATLWEAVEFYVGGHVTTALFSQDQKRELKASIPDWLEGAQRARVEQVIDNMLNQMPLRHRLREVLDEEGVPWSDGGLSDLFTLRSARNEAQHGQGKDNT